MSDEQKIPEALRELYGEACAKVKGHRMYPHPWGQVCNLIERIARSEQALAALEAEKQEVIEARRLVLNKVAALEARVKQRDEQIAVYNSGGFADADALAEHYLADKQQVAALEARNMAAQEAVDRPEWADSPCARATRAALKGA